VTWHFWRRTQDSIPPPPQVDTAHDDADRMEELVRARKRRGDRVTRRTQAVRAQNGFVTTFRNSIGK
jgi:hypothetical protein